MLLLVACIGPARTQSKVCLSTGFQSSITLSANRLLSLESLMLTSNFVGLLLLATVVSCQPFAYFNISMQEVSAGPTLIVDNLNPPVYVLPVPYGGTEVTIWNYGNRTVFQTLFNIFNYTMSGWVFAANSTWLVAVEYNFTTSSNTSSSNTLTIWKKTSNVFTRLSSYSMSNTVDTKPLTTSDAVFNFDVGYGSTLIYKINSSDGTRQLYQQLNGYYSWGWVLQNDSLLLQSLGCENLTTYTLNSSTLRY